MSEEVVVTPQEAKKTLSEVKQKYGRKEASYDELKAAAQAYIDAIKAKSKRDGRKYPTPNLGHLLR